MILQASDIKNPKKSCRVWNAQWARKLKKVQAKKTRKINFTKKSFAQIPFFAMSKMAKNQFLNWEKV